MDGLNFTESVEDKFSAIPMGSIGGRMRRT